MHKESINQIRTLLTASLPGRESHLLMAPVGRLDFEKQENAIQSAVLILLYPVNNELHTVFIKRPENTGPHSGQISFPGGGNEMHDASLMETAIRETTEEIGVAQKDITIIGKLSPLYIPVSNYDVHPYVGYIFYKPDFIIDSKEVQYVIEVSLALLLDKATIKNELWHLHGQDIIVPFYAINEHKIWGATAMILSEFLAILNNTVR